MNTDTTKGLPGILASMNNLFGAAIRRAGGASCAPEKNLSGTVGKQGGPLLPIMPDMSSSPAYGQGSALDSESSASPAQNISVPHFKIPTWPINDLDPWAGTDTETTDSTQLYVTRDMVDIPCVAEVLDWRITGEPEIGDCWDLHGRQVHLTLEESDKALEDWKAYQM